MTTLPTWWIGVTIGCFILLTLVLTGVLVGLLIAASKAQKLLARISDEAVPKVRAVSEKVDDVIVKVDRIAGTVERQLDTTLPKVETIIERVDRAAGIVETNSQRMTDAMRSTTERVAAGITRTTDVVAEKVSTAGEQIQRIAQHPATQKIVLGVAALAAARFIQVRLQHHHTNGSHPNGGRVREDMWE